MVEISERNWALIGSFSWVAAIGIILVGLFSYSKVQADLERANKVNARISSQMDAYDAASRSLQQFVQQENERLANDAVTLKRLCELGARTQDKPFATFCANLRTISNANDFADFLSLEIDAVTDRGRGDFKASITGYQKAMAELPAVARIFTERDGSYELRQMGLLEGQAFGYFRLNDIKRAKELVDQALDLEDINSRAVSGFVLSTDLKIRCKSGLKGADAAKLFRSYRDKLKKAQSDEQARSEANPTMNTMAARHWAEFRKDDLSYFVDDEELKLECNFT